MSTRRKPAGVYVFRSFQLLIPGVVALASLWGLLGGCREQSTVPIDRNRAPETLITSAPGDSQTTFYRVSLRWAGTDIDGVVVGYDVAITESLPKVDEIQWRRTTRTDSLVIFPVEETREVLGHRFYVRAIDNEGKLDETPAWIFFGARNNVPPEVIFRTQYAYGPGGQRKEIRSSNPDFPTDTIPTGWGVSFSWWGRDLDVTIGPAGDTLQVGRVEKYFIRLLPTEGLFRGGTLADTAAAYDPDYFLKLPKGNNYALQVRAIDDGGLSGSGTVTRSFVWNQDPVTKITRCVRPGSEDSVVCFTGLRGVQAFYGDTLPLGGAADSLPAVRIRARGYDPDPVNGLHTVEGIEFRTTSRGVSDPWEVAENGAVFLPNLTTGDYLVQFRSVDQLERVEGTPDHLKFSVNYAPRFVTSDPGLTPPFQQTPMPGDRFTTGQLANGLNVAFLVTNPDGLETEEIEYCILLDNLTTNDQETIPHDCAKLRARVPYTVASVKPRNGFTPGRYVLTISATDNAQSGGDARGRRTAYRRVEFRVD